ncbi:MAG: hydrogenase maturation protease [Dehalococcoidia bacterium]
MNSGQMVGDDAIAGRAGRALVAGFGSLLHGDDGFGVEVVAELQRRTSWPPGIELADIGTGGIHLVQRLLDGYNALIVVDAVRRGERAGTLYLLEPEVEDLHSWSGEERRGYCADMHYAEPSRALILARALNVLPGRTLILGCEPAMCEEGAIGLSPSVARAATLASARIEKLLAEWGYLTVRTGA